MHQPSPNPFAESESARARRVMRASTVRASTARAPGAPLVLVQWPMLRPGPGQILVRAEAGGMCRTDLHLAGDDPSATRGLPFIPSRHGVGRVVALGTGARGVRPGDRVGVPWLFRVGNQGEQAAQDLANWETVNDKAVSGGEGLDSGLADYVMAEAAQATHIPAGLSARAAAPLLGAGVVSYKGVKETHVRAGEWVVIAGIGGLGRLAVQYAKAMGMLVCAVDWDESLLSLATRLGAHAVVNASQGDTVAEVHKLTRGGGHGVLVTAPSHAACHQGVAMTRKRGICVLVGLPPEAFPSPTFAVLAKSITVRGSFAGTRRDMTEALAFAANGQVSADLEMQAVPPVSRVLDHLVMQPAPSPMLLNLA